MEEGKADYIERFIPIFNNLPIEERDMTVVVINNQPISWNMAYAHLRNKTELGKKIGEKLVELEII